MNVFEVVQRGYDSSGRPLKNTRLKWAAFDRINGIVGGWLVIVQGAFMGSSSADASAGTHEKAGCNDVRRWNHNTAQAKLVIEVANDVGDIWYERFLWQGFDPHYHNLLANDYPLHSDAAAQVVYFNRGENALASHGPDPHPRPSRPLPLFTFEEDDMFEEADRKKLQQVSDQVENLRQRFNEAMGNERERDRAASAVDRKLAQEMASLRDQQGIMLNMLKDDDSPTGREVKRMLRESNARLLKKLREAPVTDGTPDDPADEAVQQDEATAQQS